MSELDALAEAKRLFELILSNPVRERSAKTATQEAMLAALIAIAEALTEKKGER